MRRKKNFPYEFTAVLALVFTLTCATAKIQAQETTNHDMGAQLYVEDFNNLKDETMPAGWWSEGGQAVYIKDGRLIVKADPKTNHGPGYAATIWYKKQFSGNLQVQFDARVISSTIDANNINFFLYFTHPNAASTLYETRNFRLDGMYNHYYDLNGYIFTFLKSSKKKNKARFRLRRCPGFELIDESYGFHNRKKETYHVTITKRGHELTYAVNGKIYLKKIDKKYNWSKGFMGFRTFHSKVWFDNIEIRRLKTSKSSK